MRPPSLIIIRIVPVTNPWEEQQFNQHSQLHHSPFFSFFNMHIPTFAAPFYRILRGHSSWVRDFFGKSHGFLPTRHAGELIDDVSKHGESLAEPSNQGERDAVLSLLRGSRITIPHPQELLTGWPTAVNPGISRLESDIKSRLKLIFPNPEDCERLRKMEAAEVAKFGASWWPYADYEELFIGTCLALWLFIWDDETDSLEFSDISGNFERSCEFRKETIAYIEQSLSKKNSKPLSDVSDDRIITNFRDVGKAIRASSADEKTEGFLGQLRFFVESCEEEQALQIDHGLPSIEQYLHRRMGTSAVGVCLAIQEYCFGMDLPDEVVKCEPMKKIWHETNMIISLMNDMLSIKKEIDNSQIDSLIPLLFTKTRSAQGALDEAAQMVKSAVDRFELAETELKALYATSPQILANVTDFVDGCKYACTGNASWSLSSGRYKLGNPTEDEVITVIL